MSLLGALTAGKHNSSAWLRDKFILDAIRACAEPADVGIPLEYHPHGQRFVHPVTDPVLRFHCRVEEESED